MPSRSFPHLPSIAALLVAAACAASLADAADIVPASTLVVLSTTDVKGELNPCGCSIPKGGLSRRASYRDSLAQKFDQVTLVDNGNFFPDSLAKKDAAWFLMDAMKLIGTDAVGTGANELKFGYAFLRTNAERTKLPITSANLIDRTSGKPAFAPWVIREVGAIKVGYFSLMGEKTNLGPGQDSLRIDNPTATAPRVIGELRQKGAMVVVLLSQLGKADTEDLVGSVPGIDVVIVGPNPPLYPKGLKVKKTIATYGGDQGHYIGVTTLALDKGGRMIKGDSQTVELSAEVGERPDILKMVNTFEVYYANDPSRRK